MPRHRWAFRLPPGNLDVLPGLRITALNARMPQGSVSRLLFLSTLSLGDLIIQFHDFKYFVQTDLLVFKVHLTAEPTPRTWVQGGYLEHDPIN